MTNLRDKIAQDYNTISSTTTKSTLSGIDLQGAISYAKDELRKMPTDPTLRSWLTIISQRESDNTEIRSQLDDLKDFVDAQWKRIIPAPVFDAPTTVNQAVVGAPVRADINNGIKEVKEALSEINPENLEKAISMSEKFINMLSTGETQMTLRGVHGAIIFQILRDAWHNLIMQGGQVTIMPKPGTDVVNLQEKLQTLVNTGRISLDTIKIGMLYSSPTFAKYAEMKKTKDASGKDIIEPKASSQDFMIYLTDLQKAGNKSRDIQSILGSQNMLTWVNMQQAIKGFQDMGQIGQWIEKNPQIVQNAANAGNTQIDVISKNIAPTPVIMSSEPNNTLTGKVAKDGVTGWHVTGIAWDASKGFVQGIGDVLSLGKWDPLATLGIGAALIYGAYKVFQKFGFLRGLGTLFGLGAMNNIEKIMGRFGVDVGDAAKKVKTAAEEATEKAKKLAEDIGSTEEKKDAAKKEEPKETESQKPISNKIRTSPEFKAILDPTKLAEKKKNGDIEAYLNFINTDLKNINTDRFVNPKNSEHSIFSIKSSLDPSIILPPNLDPAVLKSVMRMYMTGTYMSEVKMSEPANITIRTDKIKKIPQWSSSLHDAIVAIHQ